MIKTNIKLTESVVMHTDTKQKKKKKKTIVTLYTILLLIIKRQVQTFKT